MNFKVMLLLFTICLFQKFDNISTTPPDVQGKVSSKKHSLSVGHWFRNIGISWKKDKRKSAERKFLKQVQHRKRLEEAARIKAEKRKKSYENASKTTLTDVLVIEKLTLKKAYHKLLKLRATRAEEKLKKLKKKLAAEEFCESRRRANKKKKKTNGIPDICEIAFKNSYFKKEKLTYNKISPYACQSGKVFIKDADKTETIKYPTKFRKCVATKEENGSKTSVNVFIKKSDKQKKGGKLKFFVFFAENNHPDGDAKQRAMDLINSEYTVYKVAAYLKNGWF